MQTNRLRPIGDEIPEFFGAGGPVEAAREPDPPAPRPHIGVEQATTNMLMLALRALSQRSLIALSNLFVLLTAASAWWLWMVTLPAPSIAQLVGLALYGALILALDYLVLRA